MYTVEGITAHGQNGEKLHTVCVFMPVSFGLRARWFKTYGVLQIISGQ